MNIIFIIYTIIISYLEKYKNSYFYKIMILFQIILKFFIINYYFI